MLLKESSSRRRQGLALKLAVVLCGLALLVNLNGPTDTNIGVTFTSNKNEKKVTATAGVSSTSRPASTMNMFDWRAAAVAAPAWSVEVHDTSRAPFGYCARGGGFRMMSIEQELPFTFPFFPEHRLSTILLLPPLPDEERPQRLRRRKRRPRGGHEVVPAQPRSRRDKVSLPPRA